MSLQLFFDDQGTQAILTAQKFTGVGPYNLTAFTGAQLGGMYKETKTPYAAISFVNGVGSGFSGLTPDLLKGHRVVHGNNYIGQVIANTDTTITVSDATYSAGSDACYISSYAKLYTPVDFTLAGNTVTMITAVTGADTIHAVPIDTLAMYFGGTVGQNVTKTAQIFVRRSTEFEYSSLQISSDDVSLFPYHTSTDKVIFTNGVGAGFSALPINGLVGKACSHGGSFKGIVISNTETTVTITEDYSGVAATAEIFNIGSLEFSLDNTTFKPVVELPDMTGATVSIGVYVKDTLNIPAVAVNYPSNIIKVAGIEYIA